MVTAGLVDTTVFIALETGRPVGPLPTAISVSVITLGELELGAIAATDHEERARRADTLALARAADPLPVTEAVMGAWARLIADARAAGRRDVVRLVDALIAATAITHGLPVVTQDADFEALARIHEPLRVILV